MLVLLLLTSARGSVTFFFYIHHAFVYKNERVWVEESELIEHLGQACAKILEF